MRATTNCGVSSKRPSASNTSAASVPASRRPRHTAPKSGENCSSEEFQKSFQVIASNVTGASACNAESTIHIITVPP
ncbi:MAG: hypothetical protein M5U12_36575 [Verrucomicrobia bacterium]|nr:hypothetical protein [Verrucomicrobiota bacterium]